MLLLLTALLMFALPQVDPAPVSIWHTILAVVIPILAGIYEVIVRIIPTVGNYSFVAKIIDILVWLSNFLNNKKK